jgi:hypothetical protein
MQLSDRELAEISKHLADAEAILAELPQTPSQVTAEVGLVVMRSALLALDESAQDATRIARTLQKLRLALATLKVPPEVHGHVCDAFKVLGRGQEEALRQVEIACLSDARYRQVLLRAELQGVRAELAGEDPAAALEPALRAQMIVDKLGGAKSPQQAVAELVHLLGG